MHKFRSVNFAVIIVWRQNAREQPCSRVAFYTMLVICSTRYTLNDLNNVHEMLGKQFGAKNGEGKAHPDLDIHQCIQ